MHDNTCRGVLLKLGVLTNLVSSELCLSLATKFWEGLWRSRRCLQLWPKCVYQSATATSRAAQGSLDVHDMCVMMCSGVFASSFTDQQDMIVQFLEGLRQLYSSFPNFPAPGSRYLGHLQCEGWLWEVVCSYLMCWLASPDTHARSSGTICLARSQQSHCKGYT